MGKVTECTSGHKLKEWQARAGSCDGCHKYVRDGEVVMDCRACNYYVCDDCYNGRSTLWGVLASLVPSCTADARVAAPASEVVIADCEPEAGVAVEDPRCNRRKQGQVQVQASRKAERASTPPRNREAGAKASALRQEPVDLLGDGHEAQLGGAGAPRAPADMALLDGPLNLALECAAPPDLDLLGAKGREGPQDPLAAARMGAA